MSKEKTIDNLNADYYAGLTGSYPTEVDQLQDTFIIRDNIVGNSKILSTNKSNITRNKNSIKNVKSNVTSNTNSIKKLQSLNDTISSSITDIQKDLKEANVIVKKMSFDISEYSDRLDVYVKHNELFNTQYGMLKNQVNILDKLVDKLNNTPWRRFLRWLKIIE